jgi:segregation and condensation protein A
MQPQNFVIKTEQFEGPLDLLLSLIEKRKLLINEFSIAKITDDYIHHIQENINHTVAYRADFILVASTLLLIKSRSLLPEMPLTSEEEESIEDLETRLKLYQKMKDLSLYIKDMFLKSPLYVAKESKEVKIVFAPEEGITLFRIHSALLDALARIPKKSEPAVKATIKKTVSIEEMIDSLTQRVKKAIRMNFSELTKKKNGSKEERVTVIVGFLALLEMVKQGTVAVEQQKTFDDIMVVTEEIGTPNYK